jgi:hypothetical protein
MHERERGVCAVRFRLFLGLLLPIVALVPSHSLPSVAAWETHAVASGTYTDVHYGFSIVLPDGWTLQPDDSNLPDKPFYLVTFGLQAEPRGSVDIVVWKAKADDTLDRLGQDEADNQLMLPYVTQTIGTQNAPIQVSGVAARRFEYLGQSRIAGKPFGLPFHTARVLTLVDGLVITITVNLPTVLWDGDPSVPQGIFDSFSISVSSMIARAVERADV